MGPTPEKYGLPGFRIPLKMKKWRWKSFLAEPL